MFARLAKNDAHGANMLKDIDCAELVVLKFEKCFFRG